MKEENGFLRYSVGGYSNPEQTHQKLCWFVVGGHATSDCSPFGVIKDEASNIKIFSIKVRLHSWRQTKPLNCFVEQV